MATNVPSADPIPGQVRDYLKAKALQPLDAAVAEVTKVRAAYRDAARETTRLRGQTRAVEAADEAAYATALRQDPGVQLEAVVQRAEAHQQAIAEAARRATALQRVLSDAERDMNRTLRANRPLLLATIGAAEASAQEEVVQHLDAALAALAHLDRVRTARRWAQGRKGAAGQFYLDERRLGSGPRPLGQVLHEARRLLHDATPTAAADHDERDADDAD